MFPKKKFNCFFCKEYLFNRGRNAIYCKECAEIRRYFYGNMICNLRKRLAAKYPHLKVDIDIVINSITRKKHGTSRSYKLFEEESR